MNLFKKIIMIVLNRCLFVILASLETLIVIQKDTEINMTVSGQLVRKFLIKSGKILHWSFEGSDIWGIQCRSKVTLFNNHACVFHFCRVCRVLSKVANTRNITKFKNRETSRLAFIIIMDLSFFFLRESTCTHSCIFNFVC